MLSNWPLRLASSGSRFKSQQGQNKGIYLGPPKAYNSILIYDEPKGQKKRHVTQKQIVNPPAYILTKPKNKTKN